MVGLKNIRFFKGRILISLTFFFFKYQIPSSDSCVCILYICLFISMPFVLNLQVKVCS